MPSKQVLQPAAFTLRPDIESELLTVTGLPFPTEWHPILNKLQGESKNRQGLPNTIPILSLNGVLTALVPQLLALPRAVRSEGNGTQQPWLLAPAPIPPLNLWLIVQAWLEVIYRDTKSFSLAQQALRQDDIVWEEMTQPLRKSPSPNNTACLEPMAYHALPALLANRLVERGTRLPIAGQSRPLRRVPTKEGAALMTWPPVYYIDQKREAWPYSYVITLTAQTLVGNPEPRIHAHYSVRRWIARSLMNGDQLYLRNGTSVYLHTSKPWLALAAPLAFTKASLKGDYQDNKRIPAWNNPIPEIAQRLRVPFPQAHGIVQNPADWLTGIGGVMAGMVYKSPRYHPVRPGLGLEVHQELTELLQEQLGEALELIPALQKQKPVRKSKKHPLDKELRDLSVEERLEGLVQSVGPNVTIEVWWETEAARDMLIDRVQALLCRPRAKLVEAEVLEEVSDQANKSNQPVAPRKRARRREKEPSPKAVTETIQIPLPETGRLRIVPRRLGAIGAALPASSSELRSPKKREYWRKKTEQRVVQIVETVEPVTEPTLALIQLPNYRDPQKPKFRRQFAHRDPKLALRLGMSKVGRVSQFTTGEMEQLQQRCESAVRDGLRHLGYLPAAIGFEAPSTVTLPEELLVAGVWVVRLTRKRSWTSVHLPVVVLMHTTSPQVWAWLPDGKGTRPYRQALLDITNMDPKEVKRSNRKNALKKLENFLAQEMVNEGTEDMLILALAQNARETWKGLANSQVVIDELRWEKDGHAQPVNRLRGRLRMIRLRTNTRHETPEWYVPDAGPGRGYLQGIWPDPDTPRLYYNTGSKPHTMSGARKGKQADASEYYAVPSLLEIQLMALQEGDDEYSWAAAIDQWRRMSLVTNGMTLLPLPLAWAKKMDEYATVIGQWVFPDEWEDDEDEWVEDEAQVEQKPRQLSFDL